MTIDTFASAAGQGPAQLAGALAPAAGTGVSSAMSAARALHGADSAFPLYGLSMRFIVTFSTDTGIKQLGEWSSCTGLSVGFEMEEIEVGGSYGGKAVLPKMLKHPHVVLERAMERKPSENLRDWLDELVKDWFNSEEMKEPPKGVVHIVLQDCQQKSVCSWELTNAVPVSWTGPDLKASGGEIALERLTLAHEGFLPHTRTPHKKDADNARLSLGGEKVEFHYNPASMTITRNGADVPHEKPPPKKEPGPSEEGQKDDEQRPAENRTSIDLDSVIFDGDDVEDICDRLVGWTFLQRVTDPNSPQKWLPPGLEFRWGRQRSLCVYLTTVTVKYTRFSSTGIPVRASVTLKLQEVPGTRFGTNPTSGGLPGRGSHVLTGAETLPGIAARVYDGPGRWREIAAANGFDDPLRVRPGTAVYLPSEQEAEQ